MHEDDYESEPYPALQRRPTADFNEMAMAVAASISMWALATLIAILAGYHGSGPTNTVNLLTVLAGILGFGGRRWQLRNGQVLKNGRRFPS